MATTTAAPERALALHEARKKSMAPDVCPGPCNRTWRNDPQAVPPRYGTPTWCASCAALTGHCLREIPEMIAACHLEALHRTTPALERVSGTGSPTAPGETARSIAQDVIRGLLEIEDDTRGLRRLTPVDRAKAMREGTALSRAIQLLDTHLDWILQHHPATGDPAGPGQSVLAWHRQLVRYLRRDRHIEKYQAPCPRCDLIALVRYDGEDYIECLSCGTLLSRTEYAERARNCAQGAPERGA
ncbi:hypothetical protein [Streptomyces sp. NPDC056707]|uniref:hypothetical protein n=1 Tax=Streptomyces sp. NPDC056707 TaxID=3345919 RepID=UPI0036C6D73A